NIDATTLSPPTRTKTGHRPRTQRDIKTANVRTIHIEIPQGVAFGITEWTSYPIDESELVLNRELALEGVAHEGVATRGGLHAVGGRTELGFADLDAAHRMTGDRSHQVGHGRAFLNSPHLLGIEAA